MIDNIPFLRVDRDALADAALAHLDSGRPEEALALLLADQDDWWTGPASDPDALRELIAGRDHLSLCDAMALLGWGRVGDYFAHRWTDPTFLAGLALTEAHWNYPNTAFELACGIGHHMRALRQQGVVVSGADVVFAKLWIARHWIVPDANLVCFDAGFPWPVRDRSFDLVTCHDAFYFLEPKAEIFRRLAALQHGVLLLGHIHNRDWPNPSAGAAMSSAELRALAPGARLYDDFELTRALVEHRAPLAATAAALDGVEAFALVLGGAAAAMVEGRLGLPPGDCMLSRNPLYGDGDTILWPSERYRREYADRATYPLQSRLPARVASRQAPMACIRNRELVDLPERWG